MFATIFENAESNAERHLVQLFIQRLELYDLKLVTKIDNGPARCRPIDIHHIGDPWYEACQGYFSNS